ncbi:alpha/beta fold hydrolase [Ekhidna sp.]|uniref:alpha/beta fold hydrolase n=1 Tax=Ekhidna sp. TaxID=2608089 RepID=UPI003CCBDBDA
MEKMVLVHGALGAADQMIPLKKLLEKDFEIEIIEFEGHGSKSSIGGAFTLDGLTSQLFRAIDSHKPVHIFGYSMGGFVALISASQGNTNIKSITTLGTKMKWSPQIAEQEIKHLNPDKIKEKVPAFASALEKRHGSEWELVLYRTTEFMKKLGDAAPITKERMRQVDIPVHLCLADEDQMVSKEETEEVNEWLPNSRILSITESKHPIEQTNLTALAESVRSFIQSVS